MCHQSGGVYWARQSQVPSLLLFTCVYNIAIWGVYIRKPYEAAYMSRHGEIHVHGSLPFKQIYPTDNIIFPVIIDG